jgi:hypothetical protein
MASPEILDFERLLAPIAPDCPAGPAMRSDGGLAAVFHQVQAASRFRTGGLSSTPRST